MTLPFTREQFFYVFGAYNADVLPLQIGLFLLALWAFAAMVVRRRDSDRVISAILVQRRSSPGPGWSRAGWSSTARAARAAPRATC